MKYRPKNREEHKLYKNINSLIYIRRIRIPKENEIVLYLIRNKDIIILWKRYGRVNPVHLNGT